MPKKQVNVVTIGGGTGTYVVLSGLKIYSKMELTAIVSSMDDGGSNKKFRDEFGLLPPSDFAQCLVALADETQSNTLIRRLLSYRFTKGLGLEGQRFSNLFIAALTDIEEGDQIKAMEEIGKLLHIKGKIIPITTENVRLMAEYEDGEIASSEHLIDEPEAHHNQEQKITRLFINRPVDIYYKAKEAIEDADLIVLGPGDLYTSVLANIVVGNAAKIIRESKAKLIYIMNLMTKYGQTYKFTAQNHIDEIAKYIGKYPDYVLINNQPLVENALEKYKEEKDEPVIDNLIDHEFCKVIRADLISNTQIQKNKADVLKRSLIRHDSDKLAREIERLTSTLV